jgi:hypothetical protein
MCCTKQRMREQSFVPTARVIRDDDSGTHQADFGLKEISET